MNRRRHAGLTLIELVISIVVIAFAVTGILLVMNKTTAHSADPLIQDQAVAIGEAYLEEILGKSLTVQRGPAAAPISTTSTTTMAWLTSVPTISQARPSPDWVAITSALRSMPPLRSVGKPWYASTSPSPTVHSST